MKELIEIPNYINKQFIRTSEKKILQDYEGKDRIIIYNASNALLRDAKRNLFKIKESLKQLDLQKIIKVIKKSMDFYYTSEEEFQLIAALTGSPISFIRQSIQELKEWSKNIDEYLVLCFGQTEYDAIPIITKEKIIGYTRFIPRGPIIGILPRNSEVESAYLMIQILLSKNPAIIKTSNSSAGPTSAIKYIEAIHKAIDVLEDKELEILKEAFSVVNIINTERSSIINKLEVKGGVYVIFGSNETIAEIEKELSTTDYEAIIKMGTGLSVSAVFNDANLAFSASEIASAASLNNGRDCISTNAVYIESSIYKKFLKLLEKEAEQWISQSPLEEKSVIGAIEQESIEEIKNKLREIKKDSYLKHEPGKIHLSLIEIEDHEPIYEFPAPVLLIRKIADEKDFVKKFKEDLSKNNMEKNLATSIFTKDKKKFNALSKQIPSYIIKYNRGTEKMNLLLEHQGNYLIKDFLNKITIEGNKI